MNWRYTTLCCCNMDFNNSTFIYLIKRFHPAIQKTKHARDIYDHIYDQIVINRGILDNLMKKIIIRLNPYHA